jgi:hypothetical protein
MKLQIQGIPSYQNMFMISHKKKTHTHTNLGVCQPYTLKQQSNSYLCTEYLVFKIKKAEQ